MLLVKQYPPKFHASTDVTSVIKAFASVPSILHLKISCLSKEATEIDQHSTVDYALISLRIAIERAPLEHLNCLSYLPIHAKGLLCMQPLFDRHAPSGVTKRWAQIRKMKISMQAVDGSLAAWTEKLSILHTYLHGFGGTLTRFQLKWWGSERPLFISLDTELDYVHELEKPAKDACKRRSKVLQFPLPPDMKLQNTVMYATQISASICPHARTLEECKSESREWKCKKIRLIQSLPTP